MVTEDGSAGRSVTPEQISKIINGVIKKLNTNPSALARLRRSTRENRSLGECPEVWDWVIGSLEKCGMTFEDNYADTPEEWSIFTCVALYSLHVRPTDLQSDIGSMNKQGEQYSLGACAKKLALRQRGSEGEVVFPRQFARVVMSNAPNELQQWLQTLILRLKIEDIPLDYGRLGSQLYCFSKWPWDQDRIRHDWALEYERYGGESQEAIGQITSELED